MSEVCVCTSVHVCEKATAVNARLVHYGCKNMHKIYFVKVLIVINTHCLIQGKIFVQRGSQLW